MNNKFAAILSGLVLLLLWDTAMAANTSYSPQLDSELSIVKKADGNNWIGAEAGVVVGIKGSVQRLSADGRSRDIVLGSGIQPGDTITVKGDGHVQWMTPDMATYAVLGETSAQVEAYVYDENSVTKDTCIINISTGTFQYVTGEMNKRSPGKTVFRPQGAKEVIPVGSAGYIKVGVNGKNVYFVTEGSLLLDGQSYPQGSAVVLDNATGQAELFANAVDVNGAVVNDGARNALIAMGIDNATLGSLQAAYASTAGMGRAVSQRILIAAANSVQEPYSPLVDINYNPVDDQIGDTRPASAQ